MSKISSTCSQFIEKKIFLILFFASMLSLLLAYGLEYYMKMQPCVLCTYQRIVYFVMMLFCFVMFWIRKKSWQKKILLLLVIAELCIAIYHVGVEHKIFAKTSRCEIESNLDNISIEQLKEIILKSEGPSCSRPTILIANISIAESNVMFSLVLLIITIYSMRKDNETTRGF